MYPEAVATAASRASARGLAGPALPGLAAPGSRPGDAAKVTDRAGAAAAAAQALFDFSGDDVPTGGAGLRPSLAKRLPAGAQSAAGAAASGGGSIRLDTSAARSPGRVAPHPVGAPAADAASAGASQSNSVPAGAPAAAAPVVRRRPPTAGRRDPIPSQAATWTPAQAQHWLGTLGQGLERYGPLFAEHEVAGATLLELGASDLDYMGIKPLAHRKALLRGVEELREAVQAGVEATASAEAAGSGSGAAGSEPQLVHWSHLQPLPEPKAAMAAQASAAHSEGGGDLRFGAHDEAAEAEAFKAAVMAWRNAGKASSGAAADPVAAPAAGAGSSPATTGTGACAANTGANGAVSDSGGAAGLWHNPFFGGAPEPAAATSGGVNAAGATGARAAAAAAASTAAAASSLSAGDYDEEAERRAFQQAVMEWRAGRKASPDGTTAPGAAAGAGAGTAPPERAPCYQCFRMFPLSGAYVPAAEEAAAASLAGKVFCSAACFEAVRTARAALRATVRDAERQVALLDGSSSSGQSAAAADGGDASVSGAVGSHAHAARVQQLQRELEAMSRDPSPTDAAGESVTGESAAAPAESASAAAAGAPPSRSPVAAERPLRSRGDDSAGSDEVARGPEALPVTSQKGLQPTGVATDASLAAAQPRADGAMASSRPSGEANSVAVVLAQGRSTAPAASLTGPNGGQVAHSDVDLSAMMSAAEETASLAAAELLQRRKRALELDACVPAASGAPAAAAASPPAAQLPTDMQALQEIDMEAFL